jgi:hypothetical protein
VDLLRGDHQARRAVHGDNFPADLLQRSRQPRFHSHFRQHASHPGLLCPQVLLLLRQVAQQQPHDEQIDRQHKQPVRLKLGRVDPQTGKNIPG